MNKFILSLCLFFILIAILAICSPHSLSGTISEEDTGTLSGKVVYTDRQPVINTTVHIHRLKNQHSDTVITMKTDTSGTFFTDNLEQGDYIAEITQNFTADIARFSIHKKDSIHIEMVLTSVGTLHGVVNTDLLGKNGQAIISLPEINVSTTISENGTFKLPPVAADTYRLEITAGADTLWSLNNQNAIEVRSGKSTWLDFSDSSVAPIVTPLEDVTGSLAANRIEPTIVTLYLPGPAGKQSLNLYRCQNENTTLLISTKDTSFTDSGLVPSTSYSYFTALSEVGPEGRTGHGRSPFLTVKTSGSINANRFPTVVLTSPQHDTAIVSGTNLLISAEVRDLDGSTVKTLFWIDSSIIDSATSPVCSTSFHTERNKKHTLYCCVIDNNNDTTWSKVINVFTDSLLWGDVNGDGVISSLDAQLIANYSSGIHQPGFNSAVADVDGNGEVTIVDALQTAQLSEGYISVPSRFKPVQ